MADVKAHSFLPQIADDVSNIISNFPEKKIIWFGYDYTHWVDVLQAALIERGQCLDYIIDNDKVKWGRSSCKGTIVSPPKYVLDLHKNDSVLIVMSNHKEAIIEGVKKYGYPQEQIVVMKTPYEYTEKAEEIFYDSIKNLKQMNLRDFQLCGLEILKELKYFCDKHKLKYYLSGGTCYGAAHYKGFIPWDDDIDIDMPYDDFMYLIENFPKGGRYEIIFWKTHPDFYYPFAQVVDNATITVYGSNPISLLQGAFIDIFPLTGAPTCAEEFKFLKEYTCYLDSQWRWYYNAKGVLNETIPDMRQNIWDKKFFINFNDAKMITQPVEGGGGNELWWIPSSAYEYGNTLEFEGERFSAMMDWNALVLSRYPNWRPLTEKEQLLYAHPIKAFWK